MYPRDTNFKGLFTTKKTVNYMEFFLKIIRKFAWNLFFYKFFYYTMNLHKIILKNIDS